VRALAAALALTTGLLAGCASLETPRLQTDPGQLPPEAAVAGVPFYAQQDHYCGPASLAMVLSWAGEPVSQEAVAPQVFTPGREGAFAADVLAAARRRGYLAVPVTGMRDLLTELAAGHPVLVLQNRGLDWLPRWHFAVAVGYDLPAGELHLHSGRDPDRRVALTTFERTWLRAEQWGLVVLPPGRLPATAGATAVLEAVVGLERAERLAAAEKAYAAAAQRWPQRLGAWIGLANARYGQGDRDGAVAALRRGLEHHPRAAAAWNNLAVILGELGRREEAVAAARRAVELAEGRAGPYRRTLEEVRGAE
jgi:tetratricopeptide (TPR) repeat protein